MQSATQITTPYFGNDGRGPERVNWIPSHKLYLPGDNETLLPVGAQYIEDKLNWLIFYRMQVIQIVPEEVHSYWHLTLMSSTKRKGITLIDNSNWKTSFNQRHLENSKHYVIEFYDEVVEVLCEELIFGDGQFDIEVVAETNPKFASALYRKAWALEQENRIEEAIKYINKYLALVDTQKERLRGKSELHD